MRREEFDIIRFILEVGCGDLPLGRLTNIALWSDASGVVNEDAVIAEFCMVPRPEWFDGNEQEWSAWKSLVQSSVRRKLRMAVMTGALTGKSVVRCNLQIAPGLILENKEGGS